MKYSTVIVAACIGGASLTTAVRPASGSNPHPQLNTASIRKSSLSHAKHGFHRVRNNVKQLVKTPVEATSRQRLSQSQSGSNPVHDVDTWDNSQSSSAVERVPLPNLDSVSRPLRKAKGPHRLPKNYEEEIAPATAHKVKSSITTDAQRTAEGTTSAGTGSQTNTGVPLHPSFAPLPSDNGLNMEARGLNIEDLDARTFDDVETLLGRGFFHDVKANYRARKAEYYETKAAEEKALAGIQTPSLGGEALNPVESLPGEVTARGYDDTEIRTRDLVQSLNAAVDTILRKKLTASTPVVARDILDSSSELEARGSDDAELDARDNIFEQIGRGVGAVMDTLKGKTPASSYRSVSSVPTADSSLSMESAAGESAPIMARSIVDHEPLDSRDLEAMELFERHLDEELAARGYDVADLEARNIFMSGLEQILSSKKSVPSAHHSIVTPSHHSLTHHSSSRHSSMYSDPYAKENLPMAQHDFADSGYIDARDIEEDHHESRDLNETELLERSIREELAARAYDDGDLEARFLNGLRNTVSGKKHTSSSHSSMDTYSHDDEDSPLVQRDFVDGEYLDSRDVEEELDARDFEIDELD